METTIKSNQASISLNNSKTTAQENKLAEFLNTMESNRFAVIPMVLLIMGIVGGIAAAVGIMDNWVKLAAVSFSSTISLAMVLAVAPMRAVFITSTIAIIIDLLIIIF